MNKKLLMFALPILAIVLVSAGIMAYYGQVQSTVDVNQPIGFFVGATDYTGVQAAENVDCDAGETCIGPYAYKVVNDGSSNRDVSLATSGDVGNGVDVSYLKLEDYSFEAEIGSQAVDVEVEDLGDSLKWTVDFPIDDDTCNGKMAVGLIIATDGEDQGPAFQIHNNDGTDDSYDFGTYLYSEYDNGWQTGSENELVTNVDGIEATGERDREENSDGVFTITIDKSEFGEDFHWALYTAIGTGFCSHAYQQATYPDTFDWATPLVGANYEHAELMEELENLFTVPAGSSIEFYPQFDVDSMATDGNYVIYTTVNPAE